MTALFHLPERWTSPAVVFFAALILHLCGSWAIPLVDRDEPRFAEASREMLERGDFVVPRFNGQYRFDKPPLIYWLQAGAFVVFGQTEFSARLPSAVAAALAALFVGLFASRLAAAGGAPDARRRGFWSAVVFTCSLQVIAHAKAAVADMAMIACVTAGYWAGWEFARARGRRAVGWFAAFVAALAVGFLAKGPIAWAPLLFFVLLMAAERRGRAASGFAPLALLISLGVVALWAVPALLATRGEFFEVGIGKHVVQRGLSAQEGHGSANIWQYLLLLPFYFVTVFFSFLPWSGALPGWVRAVWRRNTPTGERPMVWTVLAVFLLFSLYKTKLPHYTLPAFPLLSVLVARYLIASGRSDGWLLRRAGVMAGLVFVLALAGPAAGPLFPSRQAAEIAAGHVRPDGEFASTDFREPSLVWYMRGKTSALHRIIKPREAVEFLSETRRRRVLILSDKSAAEIPGLERFRLLGTVSGVNVARGRLVKLLVYANCAEPAEGASPSRTGP